MADSKITALTAISTVDPTADPLVIVDVSDTSMAASGTTKKSTINQLLGAGGTATLASATITGDLTVDTSTLKVDSANNRVGIVTASPATALDVNGDITQRNGSGTIIGNIQNSSGLYDVKASANVTGLQLSTAAATPIIFALNNTEAMRLNSTGLGVGVTPSAWGGNTVIQLKSSASSIGGAIFQGANGGANANGFAYNCYFDGTNWQYIFGTSHPATRYQQSQGIHSWFNAASGTGTIATFTQAMTLDASGNLGVGTTSPASVFGTVRSGFVATGASGAIGAKVDATGRACLIAWNADTAGDNNFVQFFTEATLTSRGSITYNRGAGQVAYNITSDYRLKEDIKPLTGAVNRIASLKPSTYKLKETGSACEGFIAHELAEVVPMAVTGTKDAVDADGKPVYQAVDLSKVTPLLVAAIQELTARVQILEAK